MKSLDISQQQMIKALMESGKLPVSPSALEKDFMTTEAIRIVASVNNEDAKIVFCGGTCLAWLKDQVLPRTRGGMNFGGNLGTNWLGQGAHLL